MRMTQAGQESSIGRFLLLGETREMLTSRILAVRISLDTQTTKQGVHRLERDLNKSTKVWLGPGSSRSRARAQVTFLAQLLLWECILSEPMDRKPQVVPIANDLTLVVENASLEIDDRFDSQRVLVLHCNIES